MINAPLTGIGWLDVTIRIVGILGLVIVVARYAWKKVARPIMRAVSDLNKFFDAQPTLLEIAAEFKPNGGGSLRDAIDLIKHILETQNRTQDEQGMQIAQILANDVVKTAKIDTLNQTMTAGVAGVARIEQGNAAVASDLAATQSEEHDK